MSDAMSDFLETEIINATLRGGTYTPPSTNVYVALFTDAAALADLEQGILTNEVTSSSSAYDRQLITFDADTDGTTQNTGTITFPVATATWGNVKYAAIIDNNDNVGVTGNILYYGQLDLPKLINTSDQFKFNPGDLDITVA